MKQSTFMILGIFLVITESRVMAYPSLYNVDACPGNQTEWEAASRRLNCTLNSKVYTNRYHCVATRDRSRLVEFCYPRYRSLFGKGQCVIFVPPLTLDNYTCLHFKNGCPDDNYFTDELFKYPSCFQIEPDLKCFISDESCLVKNRITTTLNEEESTSQMSIGQNLTKQFHEEKDLVPVLVPTFLLLGILFGILIFTMIRLKRRNFLTIKNPKRGSQNVGSDVTEYLLQNKTENMNETESIEIYQGQEETKAEDENVMVMRRDFQRDEKHIDKDLQQKIDKTKKILKDFEENISDVFVKTRAYSTVLRTLEKHRYCLVKGNPGDGKTTTAKHILLELEQKGMYPIEIYEIKDIEPLPMCSNLAIFIDNIFGENGLLEAELHDFKVRESMIKATVSNDEGNGNVLITTIRNDEYKECAHNLRDNDFLNSSVIDISDTENQIKGLEFQEFVKKYGLQHLNPYMKEIDIQRFGCSIGIPQCFSLLKNKKDRNITDAQELFINPLNYLQSEIEKRVQKKEPKTAVLIYILLCGGIVSKNTLCNTHKDMPRKHKAMSIIGMSEVSDSLQKFHSSVGSFDGTYMIYDEIEQTFRFSHSSVQQSLFRHLWQYHPRKIISECDPSLLVHLTASNSTRSTDEIEVEMFPILVQRIRVLLKRMKTMSVFKSISLMKIWACNEFLDNFRKNKACVKSMRESVDERENSMLVHFSKAGNAKMVAFLLHNSSEKEIYKSLNEACSYNYIDVVDIILETNVKYDLRTCFYAVQSGNIEMLFRFTDRVDLQQTELSNHPRWSFSRGGLLHEICFFGQNRLVEPILRRYPTICDVQDEQGGNALHFVAFAGQKDSFQMLVNSGSDPYSRSHHGSTVLHYACQNGKLEMVKYICETYPKLLQKSFNDYEERNSLHWAAQSGNIELYKYLSQKNATVSFTNGFHSPLNMACENEQISMCKYLLEIHPELLKIIDKEGKSALHAASWGGSRDVFKLLMDKGLNVNEKTNEGKTVLHVCCMNAKFEICKYLVNKHPELLEISDDDRLTVLHDAAFGGNIDVFNFLIEKGLDVKSTTQNGKTVLHMCCRNGKLEMCKYLVNKHSELLEISDDYGETVLHDAALGGNVDVFNFLIEKGLDVKSTTQNGKTVLHMCCMNGKLEMCKYLVNKHPELLEFSDDDRLTVLHDTAWGGNVDVFNFLIEKGLDVKSTTQNGKTVLHMCCRNGKLEMCKYLVNKHPELLEISDDDKETVLHDAAWGGNVDVFKFLIEKGLDVKSTTQNGKTVLQQCCRNGKLEMCKYLVNKHPELLEFSDDDRLTVLHDAARGGNVDVFNFLIEKGLDVKSTTQNGKTVLHMCCMNGKLEMCKYLVNKHPELLEISDDDRETVLHDTAWGGNVDVFNFLLEKGLDVKSTTQNGKTVLHMCCRNGKLEMCKYLVNKHPELLEISDDDKETVLHDAAWGGNVDVIKFLIDKGLDIKSTTQNGKTVLHQCCMNGKLKMCKYLVNKHPELLEISDDDGETVLHDAAWGGNVDVFKFLKGKGLDIKSTTQNGKTVFHQCCMNGKLEMCKFLVNKHPDLLEISDNYSITVLHDAAWGGNINIFNFLIDKGLDIKIASEDGKTVLHACCCNGKLDMCRYLVNKYPDLLEINDNEGHTALHEAAWGGNVDVIKLLIDKGLDIKSTTQNGKTVFHQCCMNGKLEVCKFLVNKHPDLLEISDNYNITVLHDAAWGGNINIFNFLIDKGLDIKSASEDGKTVLHACCCYGKLDMCRYLVNKYPDLLEINDNEGHTALHEAAWGGNVNVFEYLIDKGLQITCSSYIGETVLHMSCRNGKLEMCKYLANKHPDLLNVINNDGHTVLHYAAFGGNIDVFKLLIDNGLDVENATFESISVLHFSCMNGKLTMSKFLLSNYPHLFNMKTIYNENELTAAAWGGNVELFKLLIDRGLDINCSSRYGKSMLHWSCRNGKIEMSKYLVSRYPNLLGALDNDGMNVLHDAAFGGNVKLFEFLIDKGIDVNSKAYNGKTVLQWCCRNGKQTMFKSLNNKYSHFLHLKDDNDENVLHDAAWGGNVNLFKLVMGEGFYVDNKTKKGKTVLHQSCRNGKLAVCKYLVQIHPDLVKCIDNDGGNLLHDAAWGGEVEVFKFILGQGLDVYSKTKKGKTVLHQGCMNGKLHMCKYLINHYQDLQEHTDNDCESVLHDAAFGGNIYLLNLLIDKGLDVNRKTNKGKTVLHKCCINGKVQMCKYLLSHQPQLLTVQDNDGVNALHDTAIGGNVELFKFLLEKGLHVHSKTGTGQTVLHLCCHVGKHVYGHVDKQAMFDYLIDSYPDLLNVGDNEGNTVLHVACVQNQTKICSYLVERFSDLRNIENKNGEKVVVCFVNGEKQFKMTSEQ